MHQIVHRDMKSGNVLVWHFPSAHMTREKRIAQAGNVWLKLADLGISKVSVKLTFNVSPSLRTGTSGYMAPELFGTIGHEISAEKVLYISS